MILLGYPNKIMHFSAHYGIYMYIASPNLLRVYCIFFKGRRFLQLIEVGGAKSILIYIAKYIFLEGSLLAFSNHFQFFFFQQNCSTPLPLLILCIIILFVHFPLIFSLIHFIIQNIIFHTALLSVSPQSSMSLCNIFPLYLKFPHLLSFPAFLYYMCLMLNK